MRAKRQERGYTRRYIVMSIPGRRDDGADTWWILFDVKRRRSVPGQCLSGDQGRVEIARRAREMNQALARGVG